MPFLETNYLLLRNHYCLVEVLGKETTRLVGELLAFELVHPTVRR